MKRRASAGALTLMILGIVLLSMGGRTSTTVWADAGSMDWDAYMDDPAQACPSPGGSNDGDGLIETNECPDVVSSFWLQPEGGLGGIQSFFDRANVIWRTGSLGSDVTGDGHADPTAGLTPNQPGTLGAKVGEGTLDVYSNLLPGALLQNNIDDVGTANDPQSAGQPLACGGDLDGDTVADMLALEDAFELWNAVTDDSNGTIPAYEAQASDSEYPVGCDATGSMPGAACAPKGVRMLPDPIPVLEAEVGLVPGSAVSRSYGLARLPVVAGITSNVDINLLTYSLHDMGTDGYVTITLVQYPGVPMPDPSGALYNPLAQMLQICPPSSTSATVYGVTSAPDFDEDGSTDLAVTPELSRVIIGAGGPYDYEIHKSTVADYDGDTIPTYADRCDFDAASGDAAGDTDGDGLTGLCETVGAGNGEGFNPVVGSWDALPPWDGGQDVDGDTYVNYVDNCPVVADRDLDGDTVVDYQRDTDVDGVGDVCEIDLAGVLGLSADAELIPGDGHGYPGMFLDRDNICSDPFTVGEAETQLESGRWCVGMDTVPAPNTELGRVFADSDDDADPDLLDYPGGGAIEWMDTDSDQDLDGHTDACEAFMGSDPLDASSVPAGPPLPGDCDSDGASDAEEEAGTAGDGDVVTSLNPDADLDGCDRSQELSWCDGDVCFQDEAWYDFYDVPVPTAFNGGTVEDKDAAVSILNDVLAVLEYTGTADGGSCNTGPDGVAGNSDDRCYNQDRNSDGEDDGILYDRAVSPDPSPPWDAGPPDGAVTILTDVLLVLAQAGASCQAAP